MKRTRQLVAGLILALSLPLAGSTTVSADQANAGSKVVVHHHSHDRVCAWGPLFEQRLASRSSKLDARLAKLDERRDTAEAAGHHQRAVQLAKQATRLKSRLASLSSRVAKVDAARAKAGCPNGV